MEENAKQIRAIGGRFDTHDKSKNTFHHTRSLKKY
jgi:hypothetical protein